MTDVEMAMALNEWMRRFIEDPAQFQREFETVSEFVTQELNGQEPTYGQTGAAYMHKMLGELRATN